MTASSGAPCMRSTTHSLSAPRAAAWRDSRRRARRPCQPRQQRRRRQQRREQDQACAREHQPDERDGRDADQRGRGKRRDDAQQQVLKRVHVGDQPREQVAAAKAARPRGREALEAPVDAHPQVCEHAKGRVVPGQALAVARQAARQREELHADDRERQRGLLRTLRGARDQPRGGRDQSDSRADGAGAQQRGQQQAAPRRAGDAQRARERRPRAGAARSSPAAPAPRAALMPPPPPFGQAPAHRSAIAISAGRCAAITVVRPARDARPRRARRLGLPVEGSGRLVQQQQRRVAQESARERDALALPGRQSHAALAEPRFQTARECAPPRRPDRRPRSRARALPARLRVARDGRCPRSTRRTGAGAGAPTPAARATLRARDLRAPRRPRSPSRTAARPGRAARPDSVDFPQPLGPASASTSPGSTSARDLQHRMGPTGAHHRQRAHRQAGRPRDRARRCACRRSATGDPGPRRSAWPRSCPRRSRGSWRPALAAAGRPRAQARARTAPCADRAGRRADAALPRPPRSRPRRWPAARARARTETTRAASPARRDGSGRDRRDRPDLSLGAAEHLQCPQPRDDIQEVPAETLQQAKLIVHALLGARAD